MPRRELGVGRDHAEGLLAREDLLPQPVPALVEPALVAVAERRRDVMRRVGGTRRVVHEERLVRHQRLLLADPGHGAIGHVLAEVIALLGRLRRLDGGRAVVDRRVVLVGLAADEPVEVLEAAACAGPGVERAQRAGLPDRDLVALAELGGRIAVEAERQRQRRAVVGAQGVIAGRGRGQLGDDAHADGVVVPAREQGGAGGRAQGRRVEAVESEAVPGQALGRGRVARAAEGARGGEADVVEQDDQHVRGPRRRPQRLDRREVRVAGVQRRVRHRLAIRHRQHRPIEITHGFALRRTLFAAGRAATHRGKAGRSGVRRHHAIALICAGLVGWPMGLEPITFGATIRCSAY